VAAPRAPSAVEVSVRVLLWREPMNARP
jgi:hypothetical protein